MEAGGKAKMQEVEIVKLDKFNHPKRCTVHTRGEEEAGWSRWRRVSECTILAMKTSEGQLRSG